MKKIINAYKRYRKPIDYARSIGVKIGKNCDIQNTVTWGTEPYLIEIGDNVRITRNVQFITHDGGAWVLRNTPKNQTEKEIAIFGKIKIGNNVNIGWNAIIMPNVTIGNNVIVGAGAIVTKNVEDNTVVVGVPAKKIETIEEYREKVLKKCDYIQNYSKEEKKKYLLKKYKISSKS